MIWKYVSGTSKRVHCSAFPVFHLEVLKDPEKNPKNPLSGIKANGDEGKAVKSDRGRLAREPGSQKRQTTMTTLRARGPASPQVSVHPRPLDPRPLPAWTRGPALPTARPGDEQGLGLCPHSARAAWRGPRGRGCRAHPHAHTRRRRPPSPEAGPKSHREPRERPGGAGRERGADSGAQAGRRALHTDLGPPDASTQTQ